MKLWIWQWATTLGDNFAEVTPRLYRSAQPSRKDLTRWTRDYKLGAVLSLRADALEKHHRDATSLGLLWYGVPMEDDVPPTYHQIASTLDIMRSGVPTLVHCIGGRHRTSAIFAVYRVVVQGWSKEDAWKEAYKFGFYRFSGHGPIEDWFLRGFNPLDYDGQG